MDQTYEDLISEGACADVSGWDFSWLAGRATEERPNWGYQRLLHDRLGRATCSLDLQTGGGEVLAGATPFPREAVATEAWAPNREVARRVLGPLGCAVVGAAEDALPFASETFDLVTARHPVRTPWPEVTRVLRPGGTFLSQQVGPDSVRELSEWFVGPWPDGEQERDPDVLRRGAQAAGLVVDDLRTQRLAIAIFDIAAVVYLLRKCPWWVPGFNVERYSDRLYALHRHLQQHGAFRCHSTRVLLEVRRP